MTEIVVISGKGGTGKTSLTAALAALWERPVIADCDVDAADLHLLLAPTVRESHQFFGGAKARIEPDRCTNCGTCEVLCRFQAIHVSGGAGEISRRIDAVDCEGCGLCAHCCPNNAIRLEAELCGEWFQSITRFGPLLHARLFPAQENSGKLVALLRREARQVAQDVAAAAILVDGPPGIGCPVISSLSGADYAVIVTEPTVSGFEDLKRAAELARHFRIPTGLVINKADLNPSVAQRIRVHAADEAFDQLGEIPYDQSVTWAQVKGLTVVEACPGSLAATVRGIADNLRQAVGRRRPVFAVVREG